MTEESETLHEDLREQVEEADVEATELSEEEIEHIKSQIVTIVEAGIIAREYRTTSGRMAEYDKYDDEEAEFYEDVEQDMDQTLDTLDLMYSSMTSQLLMIGEEPLSQDEIIERSRILGASDLDAADVPETKAFY